MKKLIFLSLIGIFAMCSTGMAEEEGVICPEGPEKGDCCANYSQYAFGQCIETMQPDIYNQCIDTMLSYWCLDVDPQYVEMCIFYWLRAEFERCLYDGMNNATFTCQDIANAEYNYCMVF